MIWECCGRGEWEVSAGSWPLCAAQRNLCSGKLGGLGVVIAIFLEWNYFLPLERAPKFCKQHFRLKLNLPPTDSLSVFLSLLSCHSPSVMHSSSEKNPSPGNQHKIQPIPTDSIGRKKDLNPDLWLPQPLRDQPASPIFRNPHLEMSQQNLPCSNPHRKSCAHSQAGQKLESLQFLQ